MATMATAQMKGMATSWVKLYRSAKFSGIVGDARHAARGGYHISRQDQGAGNYSVTRPDDRLGRADTASALDMTLDASDMRLCTSRLLAMFSNAADPRRKYFNAFNGFTGAGTAHRWDFVAERVSTASRDHEQHVHLEARRRYSDSMLMVRAGLSTLAGEGVGAYKSSIGLNAPPRPPSAVAPPFPGHLLKLGVKNDPAVKMFKARMLARGWSSLGTADDDFDAKLSTVVKAFQRQCGVGADGIIGRDTWPLPWTRPIV
jgi:hypothetical protein